MRYDKSYIKYAELGVNISCVSIIPPIYVSIYSLLLCRMNVYLHLMQLNISAFQNYLYES